LLVSNDHFFSRRDWPGVANTFETLFILPGGSVVIIDLSYKPAKVRTIARWIPFANGLALSPDRQFVAVSSTSERSVRLYRLDGADGPIEGATLTLVESLYVGMHV
jgi:sugar lactone lactonase YvrE